MEIDEKHLREFVMWLWGLVENRELETAAHGVVFAMLGMYGLMPQQQLNDLLKQAKDNPPPALLARHKEARERLEELLREGSLRDSLLQFLREWKPRGPIQ